MSTTPNDDTGATLIELLVYIVLSLLVALAVTTTLTGLWGAQSKASTTGTATSQGDVMARGIDIAMRNAVNWDVSVDGSTLTVATNLGGSRACQGWFVDASGKLRQTSSATTISLTSKASWPVRINGVEKLNSAPFFTASSGNGITYSIGVRTAAATVPFTGTVTSRNSGGSACW